MAARSLSPDLNRQVLGCEEMIGRPRMPEFARQLQTLNANVTVEAIDHEPSAAEALDSGRAGRT